MSVSVFFFLLGFIFLDFFFLKKQDRAAFRQTFRMSLPGGALLVFLLALTLWKVDGPDDVFAVWFLLLFLVYGFKRFCFKRRLSSDKKTVTGLGLALVLDAITMILVWMVITVGIGVGLKIFSSLCPLFSSSLDEMVGTAVLAHVVFLILMIKVVSRYPTLGFRRATGLVRNQQPWWKLFLLPLFVGGLLAMAGAWFLMTRASQPATPLSEAVSSSTSAVGLAAFLMMAVLLAPFFEEIIFRGFFFCVIEQGAGRLWAVGIIVVVFALMHVEQYWGDWLAIVIVTFLGVVLTLFRVWTGSSIPGIVTHYVFNGLMTLIPILTLAVSNPSYAQYQQEYKQLSFAKKQTLLRQSIQNQPDFAAAYNDLAWLYAESNYDLPEALRLIDEALSREPESFPYLDTKAEVLFKMGKTAEAVVIAEDLVDKYPDNVYARNQLKKFSQTAVDER